MAGEQVVYTAIGLEGSANKIGIGIMRHTVTSDGHTNAEVMANVRHTYITPPGEGFLPRETAKHHREHVVSLIKDALKEAGIDRHVIDAICFTQGKVYDTSKHHRIL
jgi:N6-L-threonylcarbamoyladenine synthase